MKLLLDENLPHQLRHEIPGHDCFTVTYMGWSGIENGALLALAANQAFDGFLTIAVLVLSAPSNDIDDIRPILPALIQALSHLPPRQVTFVP